MAKLPRVTAVPFGGTGTTDDFETFGSTAAGGTDFSKDAAAIQATAAWSDGWRTALITSKAPVLQDMNAFCLVDSRQIAYLFQEGVPEYDSGSTYFINSIVKKTGTLELYASRVDNNTGNALPSKANNTNWVYLGAPRVVNASYHNYAGTAFADSTLVQIPWPSKDYDTDDAMDTSTGLYTVPVSGKYRIYCKATFASVSDGAHYCTANIYKNGTNTIGGVVLKLDFGGSTYGGPTISADLDLVAGDTIAVRLTQTSGGILNLRNNVQSAGTVENYINIERIPS